MGLGSFQFLYEIIDLLFGYFFIPERPKNEGQTSDKLLVIHEFAGDDPFAEAAA
jgi:hypothetical protein